MRAFNRYAKRGFTLVELMIVVAIIGVLAALAIFGVNRYLKSAKTSEAKNSVGRISRSAQEAYERETSQSQVVALGQDSAASNHSLCEAASPTPATPPLGKKYVPDNSSTTAGIGFGTGTASAGWKCLRFEISDPMYYSYNYQGGMTALTQLGLGEPTVAAPGFEASAQGDLDGDGAFSAFILTGQIESTGQLNRATQVYIYEEFE